MHTLGVVKTLVHIQFGTPWDWLFLSAPMIVAEDCENLSEYQGEEDFLAAAERCCSEMVAYHSLLGGDRNPFGGSRLWWRMVVE